MLPSVLMVPGNFKGMLLHDIVEEYAEKNSHGHESNWKHHNG